MKTILEEIRKTSRAKSDLQRSLQNSRNTTPMNSPIKPKVTRKVIPKTDGKKEQRKGTRKQTKRTMPQEKVSERSEYDDLLDSLLKIKQGEGSEEYADLVEKAMEATDNLLSIKNSRSKTDSKQCKKAKNTTKSDVVFELLDKLGEKQSGNDNNNCNSETMEGAKACDPIELIKRIKAVAPGVTKGENIIDTIHKNAVNKSKEEHDIDTLCEKFRNILSKGAESQISQVKHDKSKKLVSGKCAKPDDSDIKRVVKYAHDKLDPRHSTEKEFENLTFNLLIAGEIELAMQTDIDPEERIAHLSIAKTLCYHRNYVSDDVLREGYDIMLKRVELGTHEWDEVLGEHLHEYLNYKANVLMRNLIQTDGDRAPFKKVENRKEKFHIENNRGQKDQVIYCNAFNNGNCKFTDHHEGKFSGMNITKWHICRRCWTVAAEKKSHKENSEECQRK